MVNTSLAIQARPNQDDEFDNVPHTGGTRRQRSQCRPVGTALQSVDPARREREFVHRRPNGWGQKWVDFIGISIRSIGGGGWCIDSSDT